MVAPEPVATPDALAFDNALWLLMAVPVPELAAPDEVAVEAPVLVATAALDTVAVATPVASMTANAIRFFFIYFLDFSRTISDPPSTAIGFNFPIFPGSM